jgi:uncharacterized protein (TIGR00251 family)
MVYCIYGFTPYCCLLADSALLTAPALLLGLFFAQGLARRSFIQLWRGVKAAALAGSPQTTPVTTELRVYCQAGARYTQVDGWHDGRLKIRLKAPPVEGKANKALVEWLSQRLGLPTSQMRISAGAKSRFKTLQIEGATAQEVLGKLSALVGREA